MVNMTAGHYILLRMCKTSSSKGSDSVSFNFILIMYKAILKYITIGNYFSCVVFTYNLDHLYISQRTVHIYYTCSISLKINTKKPTTTKQSFRDIITMRIFSFRFNLFVYMIKQHKVLYTVIYTYFSATTKLKTSYYFNRIPELRINCHLSEYL